MFASILLLLGVGLILMMAEMSILWAIQLRTRNASIVDVGWAAGLGLLAVFYALFGEAFLPRKILLAAVVGIWSLRLASHLYRDRIANGRPEEGRYQTIRADWGDKAAEKFFFFFLTQGLLNIVLALPFLIIALNPKPGLTVLEWIGAALWVVAVKGEALADRQLKDFKADKNRTERVCRRGLWNYSRHPNYFFEFLIWCSFALIATASPWGWMGWISPLMMLYFLLKVTGIPLAEAQALKSRGEEYRRYQNDTSIFIPWFPKR